jgi:hypothetical protein
MSELHVSNDNPFSEAQFKTLKYRPASPERFGSLPDARAHGHIFFPWCQRSPNNPPVWSLNIPHPS